MHKFFFSCTLALPVLLNLSCAKQPGPAADPYSRYESMECISGTLLRAAGDRTETVTGDYMYTLTGIVEVNETGDVYIVQNPESRSRKSYLVTGNLRPKVAGENGRIITVKCCSLENGEWSGTVRVYEISGNR